MHRNRPLSPRGDSRKLSPYFYLYAKINEFHYYYYYYYFVRWFFVCATESRGKTFVFQCLKVLYNPSKHYSLSQCFGNAQNILLLFDNYMVQSMSVGFNLLQILKCGFLKVVLRKIVRVVRRGETSGWSNIYKMDFVSFHRKMFTHRRDNFDYHKPLNGNHLLIHIYSLLCIDIKKDKKYVDFCKYM